MHTSGNIAHRTPDFICVKIIDLEEIEHMESRKVFLISLVVVILYSGCAQTVAVSPTATTVVPENTAAPTETAEPTAAPTDIPFLMPALASWRDVPIMPGALTGQVEMVDYFFTINAAEEEITAYYEEEMANLGWQTRPDKTKLAPGTAFTFSKDNLIVFFRILPEGDNHVVFMQFVEG